jgi:serine protease AprX
LRPLPLITKKITLGLTLTAFVAVLAGLGGTANAAAPKPPKQGAYVPATLLSDAQANPDKTFDVILQGSPGHGADAVANDVAKAKGVAVGLTRQLATISGAAASVTGKQLLKLQRQPGLTAITPDAPVALSGGISSTQQWPFVAGDVKGWPDVTNGKLGPAPAIAVVDSGIDAGRPDFGTRVVKQVSLTTLPGNSAGDGYGHGTFVAGIAAGSAPKYSGAAPSAKIVSLDVMDDQGVARTSDVIAAADWIVQNKSTYNIRVANFSLHSAAPSSIFWDPLDRAVEKLWFDGIVVVAASGNYAVNGQPSGVKFAPGNDPFVVTVGAADISGSVSTNDDVNAPWSSYGYTYDGFRKPEISAPGRYIVGPVPTASTLAVTRASSMVDAGYIQLSGTSFAAPVVSGTAAYLLALHPSWTPDQVKGALMLTAKATPSAALWANGVGEVNAGAAAALTSPPNPNLALNQFVVADPNGGSIPVFDAASWGDTARANASWGDASWGDASWGDASWGDASWGDASWGDASWATASWGDASWGDASWGDASWGDAAYADNAADDQGLTPVLDPAELAEASAELGLTIGPDGSVTG